MTRLFIEIYQYFKGHRVVFWTSMIVLFVLFGFFAAQIHLEEDINKLMPSSKNDDGTTKLAFSDLRIKDKTFLLFENKKGRNTEHTAAVCDEFVDSLLAADKADKKNGRAIDNVFWQITDDDMFNVIDYLTEHVPSYIDTSYYAAFDTLLNAGHMQRQMQQNRKDFEGAFGQAYPELIGSDPIGMRQVFQKKMAPVMGASGSYRTINNHFFVPDSTVCVAFITPRYSSTNTGSGSRLFEKLNTLIDSFAVSHPDIRITYHGTPASGFYNSHTIKNDLSHSVIVSLILVLVFISICFRNWNTIPLIILPVAFGTLFGLAMMYFIKGQFSLLALGIGSVVLGVAMSYVLHVLTHFKYVNDPERVVREQTKPLLLACVTTVGSFMGLVFVNTDLLRDFGLFATFAVAGTTFFSLAFLPQLLNTKTNKKNEWAFRIIGKINNYPFDRKKPLVAAIVVIVVVCTGFWIAGGTHFDDDMNNLGYTSKMTGYSEKLLSSKTASDERSRYFASTGRSMREAVKNFSALQSKLDSLQKLGLVKGYTPTNAIFVPENIQRERIKAWQSYWTPERQARIRSLIATTAPQNGIEPDAFEPFFDAVNKHYDTGEIYADSVLPPGFLSTLMERTYDGKWLCFTSVRYKANEIGRGEDYNRICDAIAYEPNMLVLDTYYYTRDTLDMMNSDFNMLQWISMLFVLVVLLFSFHFNIKNTLLGFMPILLSWFVVLGAMNMAHVEFNMINIIISTFIFGIGVDYSIFVMDGLTGKSSGLLAYHKSAIFFSAFILIVTVSSMLFAVHPAIRSVGFPTLVGLLSSVVLSYVLQPAVYRLLNRQK